MSDDQRPLCRCIKNECLQGHCICFSAQWFCSENCKCLNCQNTEDNEDEVDELALIFMKKMAGAFSFETSKMAGAQDTVQMHAPSSNAVLDYEQQSLVKGCKCQKTRCNKWVCECSKNKVGCTSKCKCEGCDNRSDSNIEPGWGGTGGISSITDEMVQTEYPTPPNIEPDQVDTSTITGESMQMEDPTQSRDTGDSDSNKRPRIW